MSSASISKIHVTGLSLNDRFTAIAAKPPTPNRRRSRSRSRSTARELPVAHPATTMANYRFLNQLARQHTLQAALKLKRRSMRNRGRATTANGGQTLKRGTVKALRIAANGRPIKANSLAGIATMNADFVNNRGRNLRRSNSVSNRLRRLPDKRPLAGGAAERVARRRLERLAGDGGSKPQMLQQRTRSRSRSRNRTRLPRDLANINNQPARGRSRSRSRSRNRQNRQTAGAQAHVPIQARLGVRGNTNKANNNRTSLTRNRRNQRSASVTKRGVQRGRVNKGNNTGKNNGAGGAGNRVRSR